MTSDFKKGIFTGVAIYAIGALITFVIHFSLGWDSTQGLPTSFLGIFITLIIGIIRLVMTAGATLLRKDELAKAELIVHLSMAVVITVLLIAFKDLWL
jgi:hypothetical protein